MLQKSIDKKQLIGCYSYYRLQNGQDVMTSPQVRFFFQIVLQVAGSIKH